MQHYFKLSVFLRTTCRGRNWHSGGSDLLTCPMSWHLFFSTASLVSPVSQPSWKHTLSCPPKLYPPCTHHQCCRKSGRTYCLLTALFPSLWCHYASRLSASPPIMQNGDFLIWRESWKLQGPFLLTYTWTRILRKEGKIGFSRISLLWVENCFVRYQWVQFYSVVSASFVLSMCAPLEGMLAHITC